MIVILESREKTSNKQPVRKYCLDINQIDFWAEFCSDSGNSERIQVHFISGLNIDLLEEDWHKETWEHLLDALEARWHKEYESEESNK